MSARGSLAGLAGRVRGWARGLRPAGTGPAPDAACGDCGHAHEAHEHYRRGTDCGLCDCGRYRR